MARALICVRCQGRAFGRHCKTCERLEVIDRHRAREREAEQSVTLTGGAWVYNRRRMVHEYVRGVVR